ncbi:MAG: acyl-CoA thioester hydrolase [Cyclobacteriaceae bacterium]|jgi:acyl-CoA thioester hydrolase
MDQPWPRNMYENGLQVIEAHLDDLMHVNNVMYVQWIQDIAAEHWRQCAPPELQSSVYWVVVRHEINYRLPCRLGDQLTIKTETPPDFEGAKWDRFVWIHRADGQVAVEAKTTWCLIDRSRHKPMRITKNILSVFIDQAG